MRSNDFENEMANVELINYSSNESLDSILREFESSNEKLIIKSIVDEFKGIPKYNFYKGKEVIAKTNVYYFKEDDKRGTVAHMYPNYLTHSGILGLEFNLEFLEALCLENNITMTDDSYIVFNGMSRIHFERAVYHKEKTIGVIPRIMS